MACPSQQPCSADPQTSTRGQSFLAAALSILPQDPQCSPDKPNLCAADELRTMGRKLEEKTKGERAVQWAHIRPPRTVSRDGLTNPRRCSMMLEKPGSRRGARTRGQRLSLRGGLRGCCTATATGGKAIKARRGGPTEKLGVSLVVAPLGSPRTYRGGESGAAEPGWCCVCWGERGRPA